MIIRYTWVNSSCGFFRSVDVDIYSWHSRHSVAYHLFSQSRLSHLWAHKSWPNCLSRLFARAVPLHFEIECKFFNWQVLEIESTQDVITGLSYCVTSRIPNVNPKTNQIRLIRQQTRFQKKKQIITPEKKRRIDLRKTTLDVTGTIYITQ